MMDQKIIFFGPVGAGKSTAITTLCGQNSITTDCRISDNSSTRKSNTTVAMDYGVYTQNGNRIHLYGTPGQERFRFMWEMIATELAHDCNGHILLLDNSRPSPRNDLAFYLDNFSHFNQPSRLLIGITGSDISAVPEASDYKVWLKELNVDADICFVDARQYDDMAELILQVLSGSQNNPENVHPERTPVSGTTA